MSKQELAKITKLALANQIPVYVLRGLDAYSREGGDIDLIVPPGSAVRACWLAAQAAVAEGWCLAGFRNIGYMSSITLMKPSENENDEAIKLDFISGFAWYGIGGLDALADPFGETWRAIHRDWADHRIAGALTFFQKIMASGSVSGKEWDRICGTGVDSAYLASLARELNLPITSEEIGARRMTAPRKWRLRAASGEVNGSVSALVWFLRTAFAHAKFKLGTGTGFGLTLGVSGLDGSGKSTLVDRLIKAYRTAGCAEPQLVHLLPSWIPMPHQILRRRKSETNYSRPYSEPPVSSRINGGLRLGFYLAAFMLARVALWIATKRGQVVIMDRSLLDFASDLTRARIPAYRLPSWLLRTLMPAGRLFYLDASPENVVARKGELSLEKATSLQVSYRESCDIVGATILDGDNPPHTVFKELLGHLSQEYMSRIAVRASSKVAATMPQGEFLENRDQNR